MKTILLAVLRSYKWVISPLLPPACRYVPSCSEYAMEAIARHGAIRGGMKTVCRLLRCHPFARGGYDPVDQTEHSHPACTSDHLHTFALRER